jgi:N-glycosidase YbiA
MTINRIKFYRTTEPYGEFSNFSHHPITDDSGVAWPTTEHYFQAQKFVGTDPQWQEAIRLSPKPRNAADMGRDRNKVMRSDWEMVKEGIMLKALKYKFTQYAGLKALLLGTGNAEIIEHSPKDSYWADGGDGTGKNRLGKLLMLLRGDLAMKKDEMYDGQQ